MNLSKSIMLLISIICIAMLIVSYFMWTEKLENNQNVSKTGQSTQLKDKEIDKSSASKAPTEELAEEPVLSRDALIVGLSKADTQVQDIILNRFDQKEKVQLLIVGSEAMQDGNPGYGQQLSEALTNTYGSLFEITLSPWNVTSEVFINKHINEIPWDTGYDLVLMEPFTLNNNGLVTIEDEHSHIRAVRELARQHVEDAIVILQPPHPFYKAQFYLFQVKSLNTFASNNNFPYINHWEDWPATDEVAITEFLTEENRPNTDGANLWSSYLISYFTNQ